MNSMPPISSHSYTDALESVQYKNGQPLAIFDSQMPFTLTKFELMNESGHATYPHHHDFYEILYIIEGEGTHIIDFESYPIHHSSFYFLSKGQVHFWQLTKPLRGYALLIPEEFLAFPSSNIIRAHDFAFFHNVANKPCLSVNGENQIKLTTMLEGIEEELYYEVNPSLSIVRSYLHILLMKLHRLYCAEHMNKHLEQTSSLLRQFEQLVSEHYISEHSVKDYAQRIGVSPNHLTDTVKAATGYAPGQIIRNKIILEAKRLLSHSDLSAAEVGYRLNFEDASYFGRFFKRETDMSPTAFRKQIREKFNISSASLTRTEKSARITE